MAILAKVSKPAVHPHWQVVKSQATAGACSVEGTTLCTGSGAQAMTLADGSYNGQMALIVNSGGGGNKTVTPATMIGLSSVAIANTKACLFTWVDDGTTSGWVAVGINA
tara:strand:- start:63 stop:389 length:327 start_codon:yes stop_codon:yes gene_type:complete